MSGLRVLIFANGILPDLKAAGSLLQPGDFIICADGGSRHARSLGLTPNVLIGDLDSMESSEPFWPADRGIQTLRHPREKDETDLQLALNYALQRGSASIVIVGALGGRIDHTLGNISLLSDARLAGRDCCLDDGTERVLLCTDSAGLSGNPGDIVSLLPWGGPVGGIRTQGLKWSLNGETLTPEHSRGISNVMVDRLARIQVGTGSLLLVHRRVTPAVARR